MKPEKPRRVLDFNSFINEGILKDTISKASDWASNLLKKIKDGIIKLIPSGSKKGVPMVGYFDPKNGSVLAQINQFYKDTPFSKENPLDVYESESYEEDIFSEEELEEARVPLEYTEDDQTVRNISSTELESMIRKLYRSKIRGGRAKPIFIYGAPGIGKTQIVGQAADELGVPMLNLDLQFMAPEDFLGIPSTVEIEPSDSEKYKETGDKKYLGQGITVSNPPAVLPRTNGPDGKGGIIFLDEMNRSNKMVLNSIMQFVQMGRLGEYTLPDKWVIVAAGNRPAEADVAEFDFALADRFTVVNFVPKVGEWAEWARKSGKVDDEIINFVERNEEIFHYLDPDKGTLKFPTPRSWVDAAAVLKDEMIEAGVDRWQDLPIGDIYNIFADQIGPSAASQLKAYLEVISKVSERDLEEMLKNPNEAKLLPKTSDFTSVIYGVSEMAIKKAQEISGNSEPDPQILYNIVKYFDKYGNVEILSWIYKRILEKYPFFEISDEVIATKNEPGSRAKIDAAMLIKKGARDKDLL